MVRRYDKARYMPKTILVKRKIHFCYQRRLRVSLSTVDAIIYEHPKFNIFLMCDQSGNFAVLEMLMRLNKRALNAPDTIEH